MPGTIAIVGRPNVGKSALFNRIAGRRIAIVHDQAGGTRDRITAEAEWAGRAFTLVDTGGIGLIPGEKSQDIIATATVEQVDLAIEAADVTLVKGELSKVVEAIRLSRATFRKIVENLFWAWFYNVAAIPIAAVGLLHPMIGVIAMTTSSLSVIGNSLRLKRVKLNVDK